MRSQIVTTLALVAVLTLLAAGCTGNEPASEGSGAPFEPGQEVTLQGQLGCGHCNFHMGETCSAALQVAEGLVIILDVSEDHELYTDRFSGRRVEVVGTVAAIDELGTHVDVTSYSVIES